MKYLNVEKFKEELQRKIDFHHNNANDPHNVGNAVKIALVEVLDAATAAEEEMTISITGDGVGG